MRCGSHPLLSHHHIQVHHIFFFGFAESHNVIQVYMQIAERQYCTTATTVHAHFAHSLGGCVKSSEHVPG